MADPWYATLLASTTGRAFVSGFGKGGIFEVVNGEDAALYWSRSAYEAGRWPNGVATNETVDYLLNADYIEVFREAKVEPKDDEWVLVDAADLAVGDQVRVTLDLTVGYTSIYNSGFDAVATNNSSRGYSFEGNEAVYKRVTPKPSPFDSPLGTRYRDTEDGYEYTVSLCCEGEPHFLRSYNRGYARSIYFGDNNVAEAVANLVEIDGRTD